MNFHSSKEIELKTTKAIAVDTIDLLDFYNSFHPTFQTYLDVQERNANRQMKKREKSHHNSSSSLINVYELVSFFIEENVRRNSDTHFIIDELPIFMDGKDFNQNKNILN